VDDQNRRLPRKELVIQSSGLSEPAGLVVDDGALAHEANQGWWSEYQDLGIGPFIGLENQANRISSYQSCVIPGMFQTGDYARAVIRGVVPQISSSVLDDRVNARMRRQALLTSESAPDFLMLVDESALRRMVGGSQVMRHQLKRMVEVASTTPSVTLQVVPLQAGAHPGLDNAFTLLEFPSERPAVVYVENAIGTFYLERADIVRRYENILRYLVSEDCALDPKRSLELIDQIGTSPDFP
jgi:Domain of unknown function (DUF5753)